MTNYDSPQACLPRHSYDPQVDELLNTMLAAVNSILKIPLDRMQHKRDSMPRIGLELHRLAGRMYEFTLVEWRSKWQNINHTHNTKSDIISLRPDRLQ